VTLSTEVGVSTRKKICGLTGAINDVMGGRSYD